MFVQGFQPVPEIVDVLYCRGDEFRLVETSGLILIGCYTAGLDAQLQLLAIALDGSFYGNVIVCFESSVESPVV